MPPFHPNAMVPVPADAAFVGRADLALQRREHLATRGALNIVRTVVVSLTKGLIERTVAIEREHIVDQRFRDAKHVSVRSAESAF